MTIIQLGRDICGSLSESMAREWIVTNGIGGFASGTVAGILTRRYHGILIAALDPPTHRTLLVTKLEEIAVINGITYPLSANRWPHDITDPQGFKHLERFELQGSLPTWFYAVADGLVQKQLWMRQGHNTTYIRYSLLRGSQPVTLTLQAFVNNRDMHSTTTTTEHLFQSQAIPHGLHIQAHPDAIPVYLFKDPSVMDPIFKDPTLKDPILKDPTGPHDWVPAQTWYYNYDLAVEQARGQGSRDNHLNAGSLTVTLAVGESITVVATTDPDTPLVGSVALTAQQTHDQDLLNRWTAVAPSPGPAWIQHLVLAADQFIVNRPLPQDPSGKSIIAGYHWFADWGRDTMISLPGLTLCTGRPEIARSILKTFAAYIDRGMLPNRIPDVGEDPEYNTVDATLWYFEAIHAYDTATQDHTLVQELYPSLAEIIDWHVNGTRFSIHVDPSDGLIYAGEPGVQLTWMDAKVDNWVITPRIGKPVEIAALWIKALHIMVLFAHRLGHALEQYQTLLNLARQGFQRFWHPQSSYCYDVLDGPAGDDLTLRPNQLFALSLFTGSWPSLLPPDQERSIVDQCSQWLYTSHGLRSLSPQDPHYEGLYIGDRWHRDGAYHQGTVWGWLIGSYVQAYLKVYSDPGQAQRLLDPMQLHLKTHGVGSLSEIFDGDPPMVPRGCIAQAWTVAEVLRAWVLTQSWQR